jgi:hypothetical protein
VLPAHKALAEAFASLLGACGVWMYLRVLLRQQTRSPLEKRVVFLLICMGSLLLVRGPFWITQSTAMGILTYIPATLLPLSAFLCIEALMRRHLPVAAKVYVATGTVIFFALNLSGRLHSDARMIGAYAIFVAVLGGIIGWCVLTRDRSKLSAIENGMVDANVLAILSGVPLSVTDLMGDIGMATPRIGTLFALIMVYTFTRLTARGDTKRIVLNELLKMLGTGAIMAIGNWLFMPSATLGMLLLNMSISSGFVFLVMIRRQVRNIATTTTETTLLNALAASDTRTSAGFLESLNRVPVISGSEFVRESEMGIYDIRQISQLFRHPGREVLSISYLRRLKSAGHDSMAGASHIDGVEQLIDLLERRGMTHACRTTRAPLCLLLVNVPQAGYERKIGVEMGLVRKMAELVEQGASHG